MRHPVTTIFALAIAILIAWSAARAQVAGPLVVSDRWPESTSLETWGRDIFRLDGVTEGSERDKGISLYNWIRLYNRLCEGIGGMAHAFEGRWGQERNMRDLHKHLFVYGWGFCDTHSIIAEGLWQEYTGDSLSADRVVCQHENGGYHTMYRLRMDGKFGAFDARYSYYVLERDSPDARILDWGGVGVDKNIWDNMKYENRARPFFEFPQKEFVRGLWVEPVETVRSEEAWRASGAPAEVVFRNRQYRMGTRYHDMNFSLPRGTTIERFWDNSAKKWYIPGNHRDMFLPEGRFYRVGASMVGADGEKNDPNYKYVKPYLTRVPEGLGYPSYLEGDLSLGQAWGRIKYEPVLYRGDLEQAMVSGQGLSFFAGSPYLRPTESEGEWVLEFYSPYVLVDGFIAGELTGEKGDRVEVAFRSQAAKIRNASDADEWLDWKVLSDKPGRFRSVIGREDAVLGESTFHGTYRWQLRIRLAGGMAGLADLGFVTYFENGIMSIPQIFDGDNTVRFKVADSAKVRGDIYVTYDWSAVDGDRSHRKRITPELFYKDNEAVYNIEAPGLIRCNGVTVSYP